ncbi:MAG: hypothetical protein ISS15_03580 [Alphaproteobacteria bacterium]|nr:hypothetical protein [Alphaproteobacteria bacterium]MBL6939202.1 hypothetical protein [Alphaproteobacteria bacterium]MBL7096718.1 hypothetical protein [Alphaproteobacteria bacterium]
MRSFLFGLLVAAAVLLGDNACAAEYGNLYGYVDWVSDYRFNAASESDRHGVVQGGLHWAAPGDFYAGVFLSQVDFNDFRRTSTEADIYGGKHIRWDTNDLNLEVLYGVYPDTAGHPSYLPQGAILPTYNFAELSAELTHSFGALSLGSRLIVEPRPENHGGVFTSVGGSGSYAVNDWLSATAHVTRMWQNRGPQGWSGDAGLTATWRQQWVFDLRYYASDVTRADCYGTNWCGPAVVAKVTYQFQVL